MATRAAMLVLALVTGLAAANVEPIMLGGSYRLAAGERHAGSLTAFASELTIERGARVDGSVTVVGGLLRLDGSVGGTVHGYGAAVHLGASAAIDGGLELTASELERADGAVVRGLVRRERDWPIGVGTPQGLDRWIGPERTLPWAVGTGPFGRDGLAVWVVIQAGLMALAAFVLARLVPQRLDRIGADVASAPLPAGLSGLLAAVVTAFAAAVLAVTLIGIPLAVLVGMLAWAATVLGLVAMADRLGDRVWPEGDDRGARAALGGFLFGLGWAALAFAPGVGDAVRTVVGLVAFGAVVRTRVGGGPHAARDRAASGGEA